jgi:hypothetical protein
MLRREIVTWGAAAMLVAGLGVGSAFAASPASHPTAAVSTTMPQGGENEGLDEQQAADDVAEAADDVQTEAENQTADDESGDTQSATNQAQAQDDQGENQDDQGEDQDDQGGD